MLNQSIYEFQIFETIYASKNVQVYQAKNRNNGQNYTLKITDSQFSTLCEHEQEILKKIDSQRIIKIIDLRLDQQFSLTILENCQKTLEDFWKQNNQIIPEKIALDIFKQILEGIEILEQQDIVHADLCMKNIYQCQFNYKIANFECAHLNKKFLIKSSNNCNAPELYTPVNLTSKADLFSLGCILYTMIFGRNPFNLDNYNDYLVQIQKSQLFIDDQLSQSLSPFVINLIQRMVQYNPTQRPGIREIKDILENHQKPKNNIQDNQRLQNNILENTQRFQNTNLENTQRFQNTNLENTSTPQQNPELWGMNQNIIFETEIFTPQYVQSVSKNTQFFFEVAEKFGGKEFYNWKKTMYPRFMMYKKSYSDLIYFTKEVKAKCNITDFAIQLEKNDKTIIKLKSILDQMLLMLKKENEYKYTISKWQDELNTDIAPLFNNNFQKALQFLLDYFKVSQIQYSKQQNKQQNLKEMLILQIHVQICQTYNPYHDNKFNKIEDLENLAQQTIEFLFKKAGYEL